MHIVEAMQNYEGDQKSLFFASESIGWQNYICQELQEKNIVIIDPDPQCSVPYYAWRRSQMERAGALVFWFSHSSQRRSDWYELGYWLNSYKKLFIGVGKYSSSYNELVMRISVVRNDVQVVDNLADLSKQIKEWV